MAFKFGNNICIIRNISEDGKLTFEFNIPFNATATVTLPDANLECVYVNGKLLSEKELDVKIDGNNVVIELESGVYKFEYEPTKSYIKYYSLDMVSKFSHMSLKVLQHLPLFNPKQEEMAKIEELLGQMKIEVTR